jgi:hypothetical protein
MRSIADYVNFVKLRRQSVSNSQIGRNMRSNKVENSISANEAIDSLSTTRSTTSMKTSSWLLL